MKNNSYFPHVLEVHLVDHCNLNCKGCSHFSPLVKGEVFADIEVFKRDLRKFRQIFQDVYELRLMGGEPLLHPEINVFCEFARQTFPKANIGIFTNGILLLKMSDDFWEMCAEKNISIKITTYPIDLDFRAIREKGNEHNVRIKIPKQVDTFFQLINIKGDSNPDQSFKTCRAMYITPFLGNGKLYSCAFAPHVHIFNEYFGQEIHVSENDYIDILGDVNSAKVLEFLKHPIPMCRWCTTRRTSIKWGRSKGTIEEWISGDANRVSHFFQLNRYRIISAYHQLKRASEMRKRNSKVR